MAPLDERDLDKIAERVHRKETGEHAAAKESGVLPKWLVPILIGLGITAAGVVATSAVTKARADEAYTKTSDLEPRVVRLEEQRKADAELLRKVADALDTNNKTLQAVQVELAKRK